MERFLEYSGMSEKGNCQKCNVPHAFLTVSFFAHGASILQKIYFCKGERFLLVHFTLAEINSVMSVSATMMNRQLLYNYNYNIYYSLLDISNISTPILLFLLPLCQILCFGLRLCHKCPKLEFLPWQVKSLNRLQKEILKNQVKSIVLSFDRRHHSVVNRRHHRMAYRFLFYVIFFLDICHFLSYTMT